MLKKLNMNLNKLSLLSLLLVTALMIMAINSHAQAPPPVPVEVTKVEEQNVQKPVTLVGTVEPARRSVIASEIGGIVENYPLQEGNPVKKGDLITELRTDVIKIRLREAENAKREADARYNLAKQNRDRFKLLEEKGVASKQQLDDAMSERDAWFAKKSQLEEQIKKQEYDLKISKIVAPFNGFISKELTEVGQWVNEGGAVVELVDLDNVEIMVDVPEQYISQMKVGDTATVNIDSIPDLIIEGKITSIVPQADKSARTFPVRIVVSNAEHVIKSGMLARVSFLVGEPSLVKLVPKDAIFEQNRINFVYVVNNGSAQQVQVNKGISFKDLIEIIGPIETGQLVVVRGNERLRPGQLVNIVNQDGMKEKE
jgi:RND family efflux transporter MFP subunit